MSLPGLPPQDRKFGAKISKESLRDLLVTIFVTVSGLFSHFQVFESEGPQRLLWLVGGPPRYVS